MKFQRFLATAVAMLLVGTLVFSLGGCGTETVTLNISAAASMTDALNEINELYKAEHSNVSILTNYTSSGNLQTQIENGAPADVFISAAPKQMNTLEEKDLILKETRRDLLTNKVVLITPKENELGIDDFMDLTGSGVKKVALGDPEFVPVGAYGKQCLEELDIWSEVQPKLILCSDVRQVLSYVENGNVDAGIVYSTDAAISQSVKVVADGPDAINSTIVYPVAVVEYSKLQAEAKEYIDFLFSSKAQEVLEKYGFSPLGK
jgi:molybdate transport system substrate-binding protein